jgi:hypothetical protein
VPSCNLVKCIKGIASRDVQICFLVSIDRSHVGTPCDLLLKCYFRVVFFDFRVSVLVVYSVNGAGLLDFPQLLSFSSSVLGSHYRVHTNVVLAEIF